MTEPAAVEPAVGAAIVDDGPVIVLRVFVFAERETEAVIKLDPIAAADLAASLIAAVRRRL